MAIKNDDLVKVINRNKGTTSYTIPEMNITRFFEVGEPKMIPMGELRQLSYRPGGMKLLENFLLIEDKDVLGELLRGEPEPEYFYEKEDIQKLLLTGTPDELYDCLTFAPTGVIEMVKDLAVSLKLNDVQKREIIKEKTGFDVSSAIAFNKDVEEEAPDTKPQRRAAAKTNVEKEEVEEEVKPQRRAAPKYKV